MSRYFITGTDTGVGKTVLSMLFMKYLYKKGFNPFYIKPFQTGCSHSKDTDSDAWFVYRYIDELKGKNPKDSMIYCYKKPLAPYFAARYEGKVHEMDCNYIKEYFLEKEMDHSPVVLEGAGGLFVPINKNTLLIDYIEKLDVEVLIAARSGLGTINHTLMTIESLRIRNIDISGVVLLNSHDKEVKAKALKENIEAIESFSNIKVLGVIDYIKDFSSLDDINLTIFDSLKNNS